MNFFTQRLCAARFKGALAFLATFLMLASNASFAGAHLASEKPKDIVDTAVAAGSFTTLVAALKAAGLVEALQGEGPFTVFAPTDEAFAALPAGTLDSLLKPESKDTLTAILLYHVVPGKVMSSDITGNIAAETLEGTTVAVSAANGGVTVNGANVVAADIVASNGVIHVVDAVILPASAQ
jgi:uncharacterized surface protein with fasciclin (FAS1) repeats